MLVIQLNMVIIVFVVIVVVVVVVVTAIWNVVEWSAKNLRNHKEWQVSF